MNDVGTRDGNGPRGTARRRRLPAPAVAATAIVAIAWSGYSIWHHRLEAGQRGPAALSLLRSHESGIGFDWADSQIPPDRVMTGGPPKDGIPALLNPAMIPAAQAGYLVAEDRVIGVVVGGEARAYPLRVMDWHEIVNDEAAGQPFAVTYCPLCDSAVVFDRRVHDRVVEFGVSGLLYNSNVLMFDRRSGAAEGLWSQMYGKAVAGEDSGAPLRRLPLNLTTWGAWSLTHPDSLVLSLETGHDRNYSRRPYAGYMSHPRLMFPVEPLDSRLAAKEQVLGVLCNGEARAYSATAVKSEPGNRIAELVGGAPITVVYEEGALSVESAADGIQWVYSFWFAWAAFHPETTVFGLE